jgi:tubulin polyglutamylase TTLL9
MVDRLFYDIQQTVLRCLLSVQTIMMNDKHCFELYGFDILFDDSFKVYVIEVNASPSMSANTEEDKALKTELLSSAFDIVDLEGNMQGDEVRVGGFDLVYKGSPVTPPANSQYTTMLGCDVPKEPHVQRRAEPPPKPAKGAATPSKQRKPAFGGGGAARKNI